MRTGQHPITLPGPPHMATMDEEETQHWAHHHPPVDTPTPHLDLQRYELHTVLGHGGMGVVYQATDRTLGRLVAIKTLKPSLQHNPHAMSYLTSEAKALAQVRHPNLPLIYDVLSQGDHLTLVMEYIEGQTLTKILTRNPQGLDPQDAFSLWLQLLAALSTLHRSGLIHRDIKPANLMIQPNGTLRLMDMGLAKQAHHVRHGLEAMHGTPAYMAPEQRLGQTLHTSTDLYTAALTLTEVLTGTLPTTPNSYASHLPHHIHKAWRTQLLHCLHPIPEQRPSNADHMLQSLIKTMNLPHHTLPLSIQTHHPSKTTSNNTNIKPPASPHMPLSTIPHPPPRVLHTTIKPITTPSPPDPTPFPHHSLQNLSSPMQRIAVVAFAILLCALTMALGIGISWLFGPLPITSPP